jgi:hypothetical protein
MLEPVILEVESFRYYVVYLVYDWVGLPSASLEAEMVGG